MGACGTEEVARTQQGGLDESPIVKTRATCPIAAKLLVQVLNGLIPDDAK